MWAAALAVGTVLKYASDRKKKKAGENAAAMDAAQLERQSKVETAMAQREAHEERRQARIAQSRLQTIQGGMDPSTVKLSQDIEAEGEYRALTALYGGDSAAESNTYAAIMRRRQMDDMRSANRIAQVGQAFGTFSKMYGNFGGGGFQSYTGSNDFRGTTAANQNDLFMRYGSGGD